MRDLLIDQLSKVPSVNSRYTNIRCINYPPSPGETKRGYFSLVFHAIDSMTGEPVAIKFMDPSGTSEIYRLDCFKREPRIIKQLKGKKRCLQLVEELQKFNVELETKGGIKYEINFDFFSTDWISDEIDDYFLSREDISPIDKLNIFRNIILAVEAIHNNQIFHRDLKPDNIRSDSGQENKFVFVIDFGTAARFDSNKLLPEYSNQVGANLYSSPEAFLGFAGERDIAKFTDFYALGCMLYELFNKQLYFTDLLDKNPTFIRTLSALGIHFSHYSTVEDKLHVWNEEVQKLTRSVTVPHCQADGSNLPTSISAIISDLVRRLTVFDFNKRLSDFDQIRKIVDSAILVLKNECIMKDKIKKRIVLREKKLKKIEEKEKRLSAYLLRRAKLAC